MLENMLESIGFLGFNMTHTYMLCFGIRDWFQVEMYTNSGVIGIVCDTDIGMRYSARYNERNVFIHVDNESIGAVDRLYPLWIVLDFGEFGFGQ